MVQKKPTFKRVTLRHASTISAKEQAIGMWPVFQRVGVAFQIRTKRAIHDLVLKLDIKQSPPD